MAGVLLGEASLDDVTKDRITFTKLDDCSKFDLRPSYKGLQRVFQSDRGLETSPFLSPAISTCKAAPQPQYALCHLVLLLASATTLGFMMGLLDLPPEIIDHVLDLAGPAGLEGLVLSCKAVYERAKVQIRDHNTLRRKWGHTNNQGLTRRADTLSVLYEITQNPIIAEYIETLDLWDRRPNEEISSTRSSITNDFRDNEESMEKIKQLLHDAEFFQTADLEEWWTEIMEEDQAIEEETCDKLHATVALLALLPNLKTLQLPDRWHEVRSGEAAEALVPSVESLVSMSNDNASKRRWRALQSLETILPFVEEGYDVRIGLQCLQPFMALHSIRNLYAVSCVAIDDDWGGIPFHWRHATKSPLTRI